MCDIVLKATEMCVVERDVPFVSVIVPCRNEGAYIQRCIDSIAENTYPNESLEIIVADGMSEDGTRKILAECAANVKNMRMIDNPRKTTPHALNAALEEARGDIIVRMDAHADYPRDYISQLVKWLMDTDADNVGGVCQAVPADDSVVACSIAVGMSHPFGVGNSYFRIGADAPIWVDTVPFGCYRRQVFERIGVFDVDLIRNQDDEFNFRLRRHGGRILLVPSVSVTYRTRASLKHLWRMYYQYGYYKPLVAKKIGTVMTLRQLVPACFIVSVLGGVVLGRWIPVAAWLALGLIAAYVSINAICTLGVARRQGWRRSLALPVVFFVLHISYGVGFLVGIGKWYLFRNYRTAKSDADVPLSR